MRRWALAAVVAVLALGLPAVGAAAIVGGTRLVVTPAHPGRHTVVTVRFRQPRIGERLPAQRTTELMQVSGPARRGCVTSLDRGVPTLAAGTEMREVLRPSTATGRQWCVAVYRVTLEVVVSTSCPVGPAQRICPEAVATPRIVATARFRVSSR